jgi:hypothetical protein
MLRFVRLDPLWLRTAVVEDQSDTLGLLKDILKEAMSLGGEADNTVVLLEEALVEEVTALLKAPASEGRAARSDQVKMIVTELKKLLQIRNKTLRWKAEYIADGIQARPRLPDLELSIDAEIESAMGRFRGLHVGYFQEAFRRDAPAAPRAELLTRMIVGSHRVTWIDRYSDKHVKPATRVLHLLAEACKRSRQFNAAPHRIDIVQPFYTADDLNPLETRRANWNRIVDGVKQSAHDNVGLEVAVYSLQSNRREHRAHDRLIVGELATINFTTGVQLMEPEPLGTIAIRPSLLREYQWIRRKLHEDRNRPDFLYVL